MKNIFLLLFNSSFHVIIKL